MYRPAGGALTAPRHRFGPASRLLAAGWVAVAALAAVADFSDPAGAILAGLAAAALGAEVLRSSLRRVSLAVGPEGLQVVSGLRPVLLPWTEVGAVRAVRLGRLATSAVLEIETPERAYVIPAMRLGCPAAEAVAAIEGARPD